VVECRSGLTEQVARYTGLDRNLLSTIFVCQRVAQGMMERRRGRIQDGRCSKPRDFGCEPDQFRVAVDAPIVRVDDRPASTDGVEDHEIGGFKVFYFRDVSGRGPLSFLSVF